MTILLQLCSLSLIFFLGQATAIPHRNVISLVPSYNPQLQYSQQPSRGSSLIYSPPRAPRKANGQNTPTSYHNQAAQFYRPNYQPSSRHNSYYDPSYEPSNYQESYNSPAATNGGKTPFDVSSYEPSYEPSSYQPSYQPSTLKKSPLAVNANTADHENSETRLERQASGGGHDTYVDFGAHTGHHGSFGWYADFPAHKDT